MLRMLVVFLGTVAASSAGAQLSVQEKKVQQVVCYISLLVTELAIAKQCSVLSQSQEETIEEGIEELETYIVEQTPIDIEHLRYSSSISARMIKQAHEKDAGYCIEPSTVAIVNLISSMSTEEINSYVDEALSDESSANPCAAIYSPSQ